MLENSEPQPERPTPEVRAYFEALGKFVTGFAALEKSLFATSGQVANLPLPIAQAVFGSTRVKDTMDRINRAIIASIKMHPKDQLLQAMKADFEQAFAQLGLINTARNEILHLGANVGPGDEWIVSNRHLKPEKPREFNVSARLLDDMSEDIVMIVAVLSHYSLIMSGDEGGLGEVYTDVVHQPWHYRPAPLTGSNQRT